MEITSLDRSLRLWWVIVLRGALFILLGIYMICSPGSSYAALGFLFGLMILIFGIVELLRVVNDHDKGTRAWHLFLGLIDVVIGIVLVTHILASADILRVVVGVYFVFRGISLLSYSHFRGRSWPLILGGVIITLFGLFIIFNIVFGAVTIVIFTAIAFIITGVFNVWLGLHAKP
jgi:uncharacterized membrane protein HdeD (DUF308 family)